jgi:hypothetical protein
MSHHTTQQMCMYGYRNLVEAITSLIIPDIMPEAHDPLFPYVTSGRSWKRPTNGISCKNTRRQQKAKSRHALVTSQSQTPASTAFRYTRTHARTLISSALWPPHCPTTCNPPQHICPVFQHLHKLESVLPEVVVITRCIVVLHPLGPAGKYRATLQGHGSMHARPKCITPHCLGPGSHGWVSVTSAGCKAPKLG